VGEAPHARLGDFVRAFLGGDLPASENKIPWDSPEFSARMLREHLSQEHDLASRRVSVVDRHVAWIQSHVLRGSPASVLDLGCGPGLYCERLGALGHRCVGIDFSPASIAYARDQARAHGLPCHYRQEDILTADYGSGFDLVLLISGELNTFSEGDAGRILSKAAEACRPGGTLLLEVHRPEWVEEKGRRGTSWRAVAQGLFSDRPHMVLTAAEWNPVSRSTVESFFVVDADSGAVQTYRSTTYCVARDETRSRLDAAGWDVVEELPGLSPQDIDEGLYVVVARKR
jgi:SAM-dependent methyltransferase